MAEARVRIIMRDGVTFTAVGSRASDIISEGSERWVIASTEEEGKVMLNIDHIIAIRGEQS